MPELDHQVLPAFLLTLGAGLSTGIGSWIGVLTRRFSPSLLTLALSFSAGVMIFVSFVEIFPKARQALTPGLGSVQAYLVTVLAFFAGMLALALIDRLLPSHELALLPLREGADSSALMRTGLFSALAIGIHNFPEGLATFVAARCPRFAFVCRRDSLREVLLGRVLVARDLRHVVVGVRV